LLGLSCPDWPIEERRNAKKVSSVRKSDRNQKAEKGRGEKEANIGLLGCDRLSL